jgi:hypothetical protein
VAVLRQGTSGAKVQTSTETGNQHKYQTRVVSNANKVNLKFPEAQPVLEDQLAKSIANILRSFVFPGPVAGPYWDPLSGVSELIRQIIYEFQI